MSTIKPARLHRAIFLLFGLIFFLVGVVVSIWGIKTILKAKSTEKWSQVEGTVVTSEVESKRSRSSGKKKRRSTTYGAKITYDYTVEGTEYTGDRFSYGAYRSSNREHAGAIVSRFPTGKSIPVFYDPNDPESAVLETGMTLFSYLPIGIGSIFFFIGGGMTLSGILRK